MPVHPVDDGVLAAIPLLRRPRLPASQRRRRSRASADGGDQPAVAIAPPRGVGEMVLGVPATVRVRGYVGGSAGKLVLTSTGLSYDLEQLLLHPTSV